MPELPEVEIVRQSLEKNIKQKKVKKVIVKNRNVRELFIKGYINKKTYQIETRDLFELAVEYGA